MRLCEGFQIACNLAGPLGDLTGTGDQSSGKVVHRDLAGPLGDLTGTGDQPSGKVVLVIRCRTSQGTTSTESEQQERTGLFSSWSNGYRQNPHYIIGDKCKIG